MLCCGEGGSISPVHGPTAHAVFLISSKWTASVGSPEARKLSAKRACVKERNMGAAVERVSSWHEGSMHA